MSESRKNQPSSYNRYFFWAFLVVAGIFLWTEHRAHVIEYLPISLLLLCVGMHFFMHGSHGHGSKHSADEPESDSNIHTAALPRQLAANDEADKRS